MTMSSDEGAPLRDQLPIILLVLIWVSTYYLTICDHLFWPTNINIVRHHIVGDSWTKFLFCSLAWLAQWALNRVVWWSIIVHLLVIILLGNSRSATCRAVRRLMIVISLLKGSIKETCCIWLKLRLWCIHHRPIIVLDDIYIDHTSWDIWPSLLRLQLMYYFHTLGCELFLIAIKILGVYKPLRRVVLLLLFGHIASVISVQGALLAFYVRFESRLDYWLRLIV